MPTRKGKEQVMVWLRSKTKEEGLEGVNAMLCLNVIDEMSKQLSNYAKIFNRIRSTKLRRIEEEKAALEHQINMEEILQGLKNERRNRIEG